MDPDRGESAREISVKKVLNSDGTSCRTAKGPRESFYLPKETAQTKIQEYIESAEARTGDDDLLCDQKTDRILSFFQLFPFYPSLII